MARSAEEILDFTDNPDYSASGKAKQVRKSHPSESVYKKRYNWWLAHDFGEAAAKWAASWRLGEPRKTRRVESDKEETALANAIRAGNRRLSEVNRLMRKFPNKTREEIIKDFDTKLRVKDKAKKLANHYKGVEFDTSIYARSIEPNIFLDVSPD